MPYKIAGIDVHKRMLHVVVSDVQVDGEYDFTRCIFGSLPEALRSLAAWLVEQQVEEVVMESTAVLETSLGSPGAVLETDLPDAGRGTRDGGNTPSCPGAVEPRATRAQEGFPRCRTFSEAAGGPRADPELCARCRAASMADGRAHQVSADAQPGAAAESIGGSAGRSTHQAIQPVSDLLGASARRMLEAIAGGETNRETLAALADRGLRATQDQLQDALGVCQELNPVYRRLIKMVLDEVASIDKRIDQLNQEMASLLRPHEDQVKRLAEVPGLGVDSAQQIIAEVGATAATFPSEKHLSSWVGACPGDEESAEVNYSRRSPQGNRHMRRILNQAANAAAKHKGSIFQILYGRYVPRLGHNQTIGIIAHKLCRLVWKILHRGIRYEERGPEVSKASKQKRTRKMIRQLRRLGYRIEPSPSQSAITA